VRVSGNIEERANRMNLKLEDSKGGEQCAVHKCYAPNTPVIGVKTIVFCPPTLRVPLCEGHLKELRDYLNADPAAELIAEQGNP
jgi:hypothetical protein